ncbi:MAG: MFS transporter [Thermodesulfobacteriota bacterium]
MPWRTTALRDVLAGRLPAGMFYGWVIVAATFSILFITYGVQFSFNVFYPRLINEFGWSHNSLAGVFGLYTVIYTGLSPLVGRWADTLGPRRLVVTGGLLISLGLWLASRTSSLAGLYLCLGVIAGLGMSTVFVPLSATVVKWFEYKRGAALGLAFCGNGLGIIVVPQLTWRLIQAFGWRPAYVVLAGLLLVITTLAGSLLARDPERLSLRPYGRRSQQGRADGRSFSTEKSLGLKSALGTAAFWLLSGGFAANALSVFVPFVHLNALVVDWGLAAGTGVTALSLIGGLNLAGRVLGGSLADRMGRKSALLAVLAVQGVCWLLLSGEAHIGRLYLFALLFGASYGWRVVLLPALVADNFGRTHSGGIIGLIFGLEGFCAGAGVWLAGYIHDLSGSYAACLYLAPAGNLLAFLLILALRPPRTHGRHVQPSPPGH